METNDYQILIRGHLDERWFRWFEELQVSHTDEGETVLTGTKLDQAALHAILNRIRDLGLELITLQQCSEES